VTTSPGSCQRLYQAKINVPTAKHNRLCWLRKHDCCLLERIVRRAGFLQPHSVQHPRNVHSVRSSCIAIRGGRAECSETATRAARGGCWAVCSPDDTAAGVLPPPETCDARTPPSPTTSPSATGELSTKPCEKETRRLRTAALLMKPEALSAEVGADCSDGTAREGAERTAGVATSADPGSLVGSLLEQPPE